MRVLFVHGACVRDGSWWWHRTAELLQEPGVPSVAPALPSCGEQGLPGGVGGPGLPEDVAAVRQVLQSPQRADRRGCPQLRRDRHRGSRCGNRVGAPPVWQLA
jgi:hypothetical protein